MDDGNVFRDLLQVNMSKTSAVVPTSSNVSISRCFVTSWTQVEQLQ
jgi:hypothetical protein